MRVLRWASSLLTLLVVGALAGVGWYYAGQLLTPGGAALPDEPVDVLAADDGHVTLEHTEDSGLPGLYGLAHDDGYAQMAVVAEDSADTVTRPYTDIFGEIQPGDEVDVDGYYYPQDPADAFDFPVQEVMIESDLGRFPAWASQVAGDGELWAVFVHGRGAARREGFRAMAVTADLHIPTLLITYRNDEGAPPSPNGLYGLGQTEWVEVEAAVRHARAQGAERVLLWGASMGGQIAAMFLHSSDEARHVAGVVLDAPVLEWDRTLAQGARERGLPSALVPLGMAAARVRGGIDWEALDQIERADEFTVPILLFHGTGDSTVPVSVADDFAEARPDLVTYVRVPGAEHVAAWNADSQRYSDAVAAFVASLDR